MLSRRALVVLLCLGAAACDAPGATPIDAATDVPDTAAHDAASADAPSEDGGVVADAATTDAARDAAPSGDAGSDAGDADGDGFDGAVEIACGTDPADGASRPDPAVLRGAGTESDPYRLCFGEHLVLFAALPNVSTAHARVARDLDVAGITVPSIGMTGTAAGVPYAARFDGGGHALAHYTASMSGLFFGIAATGEVLDLELTDASSAYGSILTATNHGLVSGVVVEGTITTGGHTGLLVGDSDGTIRDSRSAGAVTAGNHVGGIVGANQGTILRCSSTASVSGVNRVGGLVGSQMAGSIAESWASGTVVGTGLNHGGLVGTAFAGTITDSFALGDVTGVQGVGGLVGQSEAPLVLARVYARGHVSGTMSGAVVGISNATTPASGCYFDTSTASSDASCTGLTPSQMAMQASFVALDFATPVWRMDPAIRPSPSLHWE